MPSQADCETAVDIVSPYRSHAAAIRKCYHLCASLLVMVCAAAHGVGAQARVAFACRCPRCPACLAAAPAVAAGSAANHLPVVP